MRLTSRIGSSLKSWMKTKLRRLITAACHNRLALAAARRLKLSAAVVSPVLPTASHPGAATLGLIRFARLCRTSPLPIYGLGGIRRDITRRTKACGMAGTIPLKPHRQAGTNPV